MKLFGKERTHMRCFLHLQTFTICLRLQEKLINIFNEQYVPYTENYIDKNYRSKDQVYGNFAT